MKNLYMFFGFMLLFLWTHNLFAQANMDNAELAKYVYESGVNMALIKSPIGEALLMTAQNLPIFKGIKVTAQNLKNLTYFSRRLTAVKIVKLTTLSRRTPLSISLFF